jgi:molybdopterin biosynthesis enzyme
MVEPKSQPQRIERLMPLAEAVACIERAASPVAPRRVEIAAALGRTAADPPTAPTARPTTALALRDGFAVAAETTLDASPYAPVTLHAVPVEVGDPLPDGADAVAPVDAVDMRGSTVKLVAPLAPGDGVLPPGADGTEGDGLCRVTRRLRASDLAALAIFGMTHLEVREPRICVAAASHAPDAVIMAIVGMLARNVEAAGGVVVPRVDGSGPAAALGHSDVDAVMLVGGSGSGQRDRSVHELARRGRVVFHGVAMSPGETVAFGVVEKRPVLVVPGRFDAALAVWLMIGTRLLAQLSARKENPCVETGVLGRKITSTLGLVELVPVVRHGETITPLASGYLPAQALARADGFVVVPAELEGFPEGATVTMELLQ